MRQFSRFIGIDPGATGAIAILSSDEIDDGTRETAVVRDLDDETKNTQTVLRRLIGRPLWDIAADDWIDRSDIIAAIELPQTIPKQSTKSAQGLGIAIGQAQMLMTCEAILYRMVRPQEWKRGVFFGTPEGKGKLDKAASRKLAARLFPNVDLGKRKDEGRAEALLIAYWLNCMLVEAEKKRKVVGGR